MQICLNVEPFRQPSPNRNPGGDCFACALTAAVRFFYPDQPVAFDTVWETFMVECAGGGKSLSNTWPTMQRAPYRLKEHGYPLDVHVDIVRPTFDTKWSHGWWQFLPDGEWSYRMEAWLSAGWLALAEMNYAGKGPVNPDGTVNDPDHFVLLDGQRHFWKEHPTLPAVSLSHETHVVCSAKGAYWIDTRALLARHGVAGVTLVRPSVRERRSA